MKNPTILTYLLSTHVHEILRKLTTVFYKMHQHTHYGHPWTYASDVTRILQITAAAPKQ